MKNAYLDMMVTCMDRLLNNEPHEMIHKPGGHGDRPDVKNSMSDVLLNTPDEPHEPQPVTPSKTHPQMPPHTPVVLCPPSKPRDFQQCPMNPPPPAEFKHGWFALVTMLPLQFSFHLLPLILSHSFESICVNLCLSSILVGKISVPIRVFDGENIYVSMSSASSESFDAICVERVSASTYSGQQNHSHVFCLNKIT